MCRRTNCTRRRRAGRWKRQVLRKGACRGWCQVRRHLTSAAYAGAMTGTVLYDADCGFCTSCAHWLERHGSCQVKPWQSVDLDALHLTIEDVTTAAWWLDSSGRATASGAQAIAAALCTCGPAYRLLGFLMTLPVIR